MCLKTINLLEAVTVPSVPQHVSGHECVEDGGPSQRHAEVEAKEPPVLYWLIKLLIKCDRGPMSVSAVADALNEWFNNVLGICWIGQIISFFFSYHRLLLYVERTKHNPIKNTCWSVCLNLLHYLHEQSGLHGMKQTYSQMLVFVVHCYHIKADNFRHGQQDRNNPNQTYFKCCPRWNPDAFDSIPGYDSSVSA